jgi:hypothetical protein
MKALRAWWVCGSLVLLTACDSLFGGGGAGSASARSSASAPAPTASGAAPSTAATAAPVPPGSGAASAAPGDGTSTGTQLSDTDLSTRGTHWKGWSVKAPAGAKLSDEHGGTRIEAPGFDILISLKKPHLKKVKAEVEKDAKGASAKVNWTSDSPEGLAWNVESGSSKSYFFFEVVTAGKKKVSCRSTPAHGASEAQVAVMRDACQSLHKL